MYKIKVGEKEYEVNPAKKAEEGSIDGKEYQLNLVKEGKRLHILRDHKSYTVSVVKADYEQRSFVLRVNNTDYELEAKDRFDLLLEELGMADLAAGKLNDLKAPMPGLVLSIQVQAGDSVKKGDSLVVLEAMKMENVLKAESDAVVKSVNVTQGQAVDKNLVLIEFEAQG